MTLVAALVSAVVVAATPDRMFPVEPPDEASVGPRPVFQIGFEIGEQSDARDLLFRIVLEPRRDGEPVVFDQRERNSGWHLGEHGRAVYSPRRPLPDGEYEWGVASWNGHEWVEGDARFLLRIDSVPPADVDGLRLEWDAERHAMVLRWDPVTRDRDGGTEYVARYRVYRFVTKPFVLSKAREIGVTEEPWLLLAEEASPADVTYYRVTAQDEAGNEPERRRR